MKVKKRIILGIATVAFAGVMLVGNYADAARSTPTFFKRVGDAITTLVSTWEIGSSADRIAKLWTTDLDVSGVLAIGGTIESGGINLPDNTKIQFGTGEDSVIYYNGTDTFWDLSEVGTGDLMIASETTFPSPDPGMVHIWSGDAGAVIGEPGTTLTIEDNTSTGLSILTPNNGIGIIYFGAPADPKRGGILYNQSTASPADTLIFQIAGIERLHLSASALSFRQATTISTTDTNDLMISAGGQVIFPDDKIVTFGTTQDIAFVSRSTSLTGNTALTDVLVGTPVTFALAPDSLIISNTTASGDIMVAANRGGNSEDYIFIDASAGELSLTAPLGALTIDSDVGAVNVFTGSGTADDFTINTDLFVVEGDTGDVGIGITDPAAQLHIYVNNADTADSLTIEQDGTGDAVIEFLLTGLDSYAVGIDNDDGNFFKIDNTGPGFASAEFEIQADGDVILAESGGNVGIGTASPSAALNFGVASTIDTITGDLTLAPAEDGQLVLTLSVTNPAAEWNAVKLNPTISETSASNGNNIFGIDQTLSFASGNTQNWTGDIAGMRIFSNFSSTGNTYAVSTFQGLRINNAINLGSATLTNQYGIYVANLTSGGSDYGVYIQGADTYSLWVDSGDSRFDGHVIDGGTSPGLSSCGTTPSVDGGDYAGKVTIGTGTTTSCTVTFDVAYAAAPACTITGENTAVTYAGTTATSTLTILSSADMASDVISYICIGL